MRALFLLCALCTTACASKRQPERVDARQPRAVERVLGLLPYRIEAGGTLFRVDRCPTDAALVVPPPSTIQVRVGPGFHTLTGGFAVCGESPPSPASFAAAFVERRGRVDLFDHRIGPRTGDRANRAHPFAVTFFAGAEGVVVLSTRAELFADTAWIGLRLSSRPAANVR